MNTTEVIVGRMYTGNGNYPNIGDTVIAHEIGGAEAWNDEPCVVTAIDRTLGIINGEFKSHQKPDDTVEFGFRIWSPANPVTAADVQIAEPEMDIDAYKLAIEALNREIASLKADVERVNNQSDSWRTVATNNATDFDAVGKALMEEAENRNWCNEYDEFVERVNSNLIRNALPVREQEYEVEIEVIGSLTTTTTVSVTATSQEAANEMVENDMDSYVDPDEILTDAARNVSFDIEYVNIVH